MKSSITFIFFLGLILLSSCSRELADLELKSGKFFSKRPSNTTHFIAVIELKTPSLNELLLKNKSISDVDRENIIKEQADLITELSSISADIKVLNQYRFVLNAVAVSSPVEFKEKLKALPQVELVENAAPFSRPKTDLLKMGLKRNFPLDSTQFIGAHKVHQELGIKGKGVSVGIIDTGIDYVHAMLGGDGSEDTFKSIDPSLETAFFPNQKVVGGIDLVGTTYNSASPIFTDKIPKPDQNPLDEGGHGTHVAGTVAGLGDGINTYDGVAPEASLHAIKVFGAEGSTDDFVVIAALEYAMDPNGDLDPSDKLDVVNLSLGSSYGKPYILYSKASQNLVRAGVSMVASAGNSGHNDYITGAPATSDEALSVAASVDGMEHNYKFPAVLFTLGTETSLVEAVEASFSTLLENIQSLDGEIVYAGDAASDFDEQTKNSLKGKVALIDRGKVSFSEKMKRAIDAGAIAMIVANNQVGDPFGMGGGTEGEYTAPAIMISKDVGDKIKAQLKLGTALVNFKTPDKIIKPELIDTLTSFSSKGPRSYDSAFKPEISAPGSNIISAAFGKGNKGTKMSGTSMAGPHMAGVMALLVERYPTLTALELKNIAMSRAVSITDKNKVIYPLTQQGAGRVDAYRAATALLLADQSSLSLGNHTLEKSKSFKRKINLKNLSDKEEEFSVSIESTHPEISGKTLSSFKLAPNASLDLPITFTISSKNTNALYYELDGFVKVSQNGNETYRLPFLAVVKNVSNVSVSNYKIHSTNIADSKGSLVSVELMNESNHPAIVEVFNFLAKDNKKAAPLATTSNRACDLEAVGTRIIQKDIEGVKKNYLQFGIKLHEAITHFEACLISILIDSNSDGIAEQELIGAVHDKLLGMPEANKFNSFLLDAALARELRVKFETDFASAPTDKKPEEDYTPAILDMNSMSAYHHSSIAVVEADLDLLQKSKTGELNFKLAVVNEESRNVESDDFLGSNVKRWHKLDLNNQAFNGISPAQKLEAMQSLTIELEKGSEDKELMILTPTNTYSSSIKDQEMFLLKNKF
jgi:minor extracellular serine protease Vpr